MTTIISSTVVGSDWKLANDGEETGPTIILILSWWEVHQKSSEVLRWGEKEHRHTLIRYTGDNGNDQ